MAENFPVGARSAALGHASVSLNDLWAMQHNQSGLAYLKKVSAGASYENRFLVPELNFKALALALPTKEGIFGLSISSFGYALYNQNKYGLAYGKAFGEKISAGIQLDCFTTQIAEGYGHRTLFAVEAGIQAKPINNLTIGFHLFNPTLSKVNIDYIPTVIRIGFNYKFSDKVFVAFETEKGINVKQAFKMGMEYSLIKELYLRAGISTNPSLNAFGFGFNFKQFKLDFATSFHPVLGFTSTMGLSYEMK